MAKAPKKITLILADDEPVARAGIRSILSQAEDIEVIGEAQDGFEVQKMVAELRPRILLLDLKMPGPRPADLERWVRENYPKTVTLVLTAHHREAHLAHMMEAGVAGYLKKDVPENVLIDSIRKAARGIVHFDEDQISEAAHWQEEVGKKWESLSEREREILKWIARGAQNRFIASEVCLTKRTVENHVAHILKKLDLNSRQLALMWMLSHFPEEVENGRDE
jgi:two-component system nitrate/nitrite response regulator NarL